MATDASLHLFESLTLGRIATYIATLTVVSFIVDFARKPRYTQSLPRVGFGDSFLGTLKNWFYFATRYTSWLAEGHEKVW
jgi:hypothetical protein